MKGAIQNIFIGLTLLTLTIPSLLALLDVKSVENCEKRELQTLPSFSFSEKFDQKLKDPVWETVSMKLKKYIPFLNINVFQFKKSLREIVND